MTNTKSNKMPDSNNLRSDPTAIRQSFRVPVEYQDEIKAIIDNQTYQVVDISPEGINIADKAPSSFKIGQLVEGCELNIPDNQIKGLSARIVHSSCDSNENRNIGIQWISPSDEAQQQIARTVSKIKQRLRQSASQ